MSEDKKAKLRKVLALIQAIPRNISENSPYEPGNRDSSASNLYEESTKSLSSMYSYILPPAYLSYLLYILLSAHWD